MNFFQIQPIFCKFENQTLKEYMIKALVDVHTHTIASGHAYSTLHEMVTAARQKGLKVYGITEHGPAFPGTCSTMYFRNFGIIPRQWDDMRLLMGAEMNIMDTEGHIDDQGMPMYALDFVIAGIHRQCWTPGTADENTEGMIAVIKNPLINIISHPGDGTADLHFEPIVLAAKECGTLLEINNSSLNPVRHKVQAKPNNLEILRLCKKYEVPVILGSDAHIIFDIANYCNLPALLQETEFPDSLILNDKPEQFLQIIEKKKALM